MPGQMRVESPHAIAFLLNVLTGIYVLLYRRSFVAQVCLVVVTLLRLRLLTVRGKAAKLTPSQTPTCFAGSTAASGRESVAVMQRTPPVALQLWGPSGARPASQAPSCTPRPPFPHFAGLTLAWWRVRTSNP